MTDYFDLTELVLKHLPVKRKTNPSGFYICCPMCTMMGERRNDTKFRGGFTVLPDKSFIYHCYNCNYATKYEVNGRISKNLMKFLNKIGIDSKEIPIRLRLLKNNEKIDTVIINKNIPDVVVEFDSVSLPIGSKSINEWLEDTSSPIEFCDAYKYLISRGEPILNGWNYFWTPNKNFSWNQRIIIPFYHHSKIVGYTGRTFTKNNKISKYYSRQPEHFLFNQDKIESDNDILFLTEGIFDAISIKGIGVLGNSLTDKQLNLLNASKKHIILIPDRNEASRRLMEQCLSQGWNISIPELWMDDNDIRDCASSTEKYGQLVTIEQIMLHATNNNTKIQLRFNMWIKK